MSGVAGWRCGECGGEKFPEGMHLALCPVCDRKIHAGCWPRHEEAHRRQDPAAFAGRPPRRGVVGAYGVIRWQAGAGTSD